MNTGIERGSVYHDGTKWRVASKSAITDLGLVVEYRDYRTGVHWVRGYECPWPLPFPAQEALF